MRRKKEIPAMMPQKKWLSKAEAMAYTDLGENEFNALATDLTTSCPTGGKKSYYLVDELNKVFERTIIKRSIVL